MMTSLGELIAGCSLPTSALSSSPSSPFEPCCCTLSSNHFDCRGAKMHARLSTSLAMRET
eukprot:6177128-Prymnesium_polylepis.1